MQYRDFIILMSMVGAFVLIGIFAILWGKSEEKRYYNALSSRPDAREFLEHLPWRPEPGALKVGGLIAIVIGLVMLILGGSLRLWG
jgi:hypothetical protein